MIPDDLLRILRCPVTGQTLALADEAMLAQANAKTAAMQPAKPLTAALVRVDRQVLYPVRDEIPVLLAEEAVAL